MIVPENVVLPALLPPIVSWVAGSTKPMRTAPLPQGPSASEPICALTPSAIASVAPVFTVTKVWPGVAVFDATTSTPALISVDPA